jgi:uncharacterized protein YndB with AHSA1/START domain
MHQPDTGGVIRAYGESSAAPDAAAARAAGRAGYARQLTISAARERVFEAIATVDGPRHWWTTQVTGSAAPGGELCFGFAGLDEQIVMRVGAVRPPAAVCWQCVAHTRGAEWTGSIVRYELTERGADACRLDFRHEGIARDVVAGGWDHFLASLASYAEHGAGRPFGA